MTLSKDTIIGELLDRDQSCEAVFDLFDMPCVGCPSSRGETLEEACGIHDVDLAELMGKLRTHLGI